MRILIIGCNGFIGRNLFQYFKIYVKAQVYGCDIQEGNDDPAYFCIGKDNDDFIIPFRTNIFDLCINCSGAASVPNSLKNPMLDYQLNTINVFKMLEAIRLYQTSCKFLNLSSAAVYGNPKKLPVSEQDILDPVSPYGLHKMHAEQICQSFYVYWQIPTFSVRIFSAYGPGLKKQLFWDLYQKSLDTDMVEVFGTGEETRDFIFIDDMIQAIELVVQKANFNGGCINVANGCAIKISDAVHGFYDALGWKGDVHFIGEVRKGDPINWQAEIQQLRSLGYDQKFDLETGLSMYAKWLKEKA